jgi:general secretion pathway protein A
MPAAELMAYLADELGAPCDSTSTTSIQHSVRRIQRLLAENSRGGRHAVVVVDEAHLLDGNAALESLRMLMNFQTESQPDLTLLIVGQPRLVPVLERMRQFEERVAVKCLLRSLTLEETVSYVSHRLTAAGATRSIFDSAALEAIHQLTLGIPRQINRLCDLCLLIGYADEQQQLDASRVAAVCQELVAVAPE